MANRPLKHGALKATPLLVADCEQAATSIRDIAKEAAWSEEQKQQLRDCAKRFDQRAQRLREAMHEPQPPRVVVVKQTCPDCERRNRLRAQAEASLK